MPEIELTTKIETLENIQLIHVSGPLDATTLAQFREAMVPCLGHPPFRVVLDCERLTYVNSPALVLLARYQREANRDCSFFGLAALNAPILKVVKAIGMDRVLKLYPTVEEALQAAKAH
jgi:anti-sigma B factor antagonist